MTGEPYGGTEHADDQKACANNERMTCWVPSCRRTHLLMRDGAGWWWCWCHWRTHKLWSRILPAGVRWSGSNRGIVRRFTEEDEVPRWVILVLSLLVIVFGVLLLVGVDLSV